MNRADFDRMLLATRNLANEQDSDAVLFLGSPTDPIPRALIIDTDLPFEARVLWCYFRSLSDSPGSAGITPGYDTIQKELGIGRRNTVSNCLSALHITRWITIMPQAGQQRRIYLLHDTPLTFDQAVELDPGYTDRLSAAMKNPVLKIRSLAQRVLDGAMEFSGEDTPCADLYRLSGFSPRPGPPDEGNGGGVWSFMFQRQNPSAGSGEEEPAAAHEPRDDSTVVVLDFHDEILAFSPGNKSLATLKLGFLPAGCRQMYLDDLAVQVLQKASGKNPIRSPIKYLQWMVNQHVEKGDSVLSGDAEKLETMLAEVKRNRLREANGPLHEELDELRREHAHFSKMARHIDRPDDWIMERIEETASQIGKIERTLQEAYADGD